ncbi:MAG TPA: EamA family transporter [Blastocatellia bacterium]
MLADQEANKVVRNQVTSGAAGGGEFWALAGVLAYSAGYLFDRIAVKNADPIVGPLIHGMPNLVLGIVLVASKRTYRQLNPSGPGYIGIRAILSFVIPGVLATLGLLAYYFALRLGGIAITIPVQQTYIIWGALVGWLYLGERIGRISAIGIGILMIGLFVLALGQMHGVPVSNSWYYAVPLALVAAAAYGISGVLWRDGQLRGADTSTGILIQYIVSEITALACVMGFGRFHLLLHAPKGQVEALLTSGVLAGVIAVYCVFTSLRLMSVARTYTFFSLLSPVSAILAYLFLRENINWQMGAGILIVCAGVVVAEKFKPAGQKAQVLMTVKEL